MRLTKVITFGDGCIVMDNSVGIDFHISSCGNRRSVGDNNHNPQDQCNVLMVWVMVSIMMLMMLMMIM